MKTVSAFIDALGGTAKFGKLFYPRTRQQQARACDIERRGYLPFHHWSRALTIARRHKLTLTAEHLMAWQRRARRHNPLKRGVEEGVLRDKSQEGRKR